MSQCGKMSPEKRPKGALSSPQVTTPSRAEQWEPPTLGRHDRMCPRTSCQLPSLRWNQRSRSGVCRVRQSLRGGEMATAGTTCRSVIAHAASLDYRCRMGAACAKSATSATAYGDHPIARVGAWGCRSVISSCRAWPCLVDLSVARAWAERGATCGTLAVG
jgi:hypothetical protein